MPFVSRDGRRLHFSVHGEGPGVVLVPGLGSGARQFGTLPRRFARSGFTCAAVDPIGLDPSGPLPGDAFDFDAAAADLRAVAAELPPPVSLVGTSLGGKLALRASSQAPAVHRLVLLCSAAVVSARARRTYRLFELLCSEVDPRWFGELTAPLLFGSTFLQQREGVVDDIIRSTHPTAEARAFMRLQARALQQFDGSADAAACSIPTLCLGGAEDTLTPPAEVEATAARIAHATCRIVAAAGHSLLLESALAYDLVVGFLRAAD